MAHTAYTCSVTEQACTLIRAATGPPSKYCYRCCIEVLKMMSPSRVVAATITIAVAFRRFSVWSGARTDISHVATYEQCAAHRTFFGPQMRCTCCARVGPTEAFLMSEIPCQTQILN